MPTSAGLDRTEGTEILAAPTFSDSSGGTAGTQVIGVPENRAIVELGMKLAYPPVTLEVTSMQVRRK